VKGDGVNAVASFGAVVSDYPQLPMGYVLLADAYLVNRNPKLANEALQKALNLAPRSREIQREAVRVYAAQKDFRRAEEQLRKLIVANPEDLASRADLGDLYLIRKDFRNAEAEYSALKKRAAGIPIGYVKFSGLYLARGDVDGAVREMEQAVRLNPQSESLFSSLVGLQIRGNRYDRAIALCEARIARNPRNETALGLLGQIFTMRHDYAKAIESYRKVIAISPKNWLAANNLAFLIGESAATGKGLEEALYWAENARRIKPDEPTVLDTIGWIYCRKGNTDKAVESLSRAQILAPRSGVVNYHLGMSLYKKGDKAGARKYLEKAVSGKGDFPGKEEARMILAKP
jgi:tetratricopeptide (TPR) repeat protein